MLAFAPEHGTLLQPREEDPQAWDQDAESHSGPLG